MQEIRLAEDVAVQIVNEGEQTFHNIKYKKAVNCVVAVDGVNKTFRGFPRIVLSQGESQFKEEMYFQFWINEKTGEEYKMNTGWENIECHLGAFDGIKFLEVALQYIKSRY